MARTKKEEQVPEEVVDQTVSEETDDEDEVLDNTDEDSVEEDRGDEVDPEEEGDEDDSEEEDEEPEEKEQEIPKRNKTRDIPKSRFDEVIRQRDDQRKQNEWLQEQLTKLLNKEEKAKEKEPEPPTYDFEGAEEKYIALIVEGENAKAAKLRREIDSARDTLFNYKLDKLSKSLSKDTEAASAKLVEEDKFSRLVEAYEIKYPFLNSEHEDFNEEAVETVNTLLSGFMANGLSRSEALKKAVTRVTALFEPSTSKAKKTSLAQERKVEAGKKAAQAAKSQPVRTKSSVSHETGEKKANNVFKMSDKEFSNLSEKEKRILRGD